MLAVLKLHLQETMAVRKLVLYFMLYCMREARSAQCLTLRTSQPVVGRHSPVFDRPILCLMYSIGAAVVDSAVLSHSVLTIRKRNLQVKISVGKLVLCCIYFMRPIYIREARSAQCLYVPTPQPVVRRHSPVFDRCMLFIDM